MGHRKQAEIFSCDRDKSPLFTVLQHCIIIIFFFLLQIGEAKQYIAGLGFSVFNIWYSPCCLSGIQETFKQGLSEYSWSSSEAQLRVSEWHSTSRSADRAVLRGLGRFPAVLFFYPTQLCLLSIPVLCSLSHSCLPSPNVNYQFHTPDVFCCVK